MHTKVEYNYLSIRLSQFYLIWRAIMDVTFGLVGLIFMCCALPFLALLIYLDSPGPIFYTQERVGYRGQKFTVYKFRSMTNGAERKGQAIWAIKDDPRVTRIGRFLRASHFDELPQVLNILRGEMSLIGPRPERLAYAAELEAINPLYRQRLSIKPGLTGWAQVNYGYGTTSKDELEKLEFDLYYIQYQSFLLDIRILLRTVREVVLCHGI